MTEEEMQDHILLQLADLYEDAMSRTQWKRFTFQDSEDKHTGLLVLRRLVANLLLDQKEPGVVRLSGIGYALIKRDLARLRTKLPHAPAPEVNVPLPTPEQIQKISGALGEPPDYVSASRIFQGQSEMFWATDGFQRVTGYSVGELKNLGGTVMLPANADIEKLKDIAERLLNGEKISGDYEIKVKRGDLVTIRFVAWPLFDEEGRVVGTLTAARRIKAGDKNNRIPNVYIAKRSK